MTHASTNELHPVRPLVRVIEKSAEFHESLEALIRRKIRLMRSGDIAGLRLLGDEESGLIERIRENEGLRRQACENAGKKLGMSAERARRTTLAQWAQRADEAVSQQIQAAAHRLRKALVALASANRIAGDAAKTTVGHLHAVFRFEDFSGQQVRGYDRGGGLTEPSSRMIFETVG